MSVQAGAYKKSKHIETGGIAMQVEGTPVYRARDVAAMVDVDVSTIYRAIRTGELTAYRVGKLLRIPASAIDAYLHKRPAAAPTAVTDQDSAVEPNCSHATRPT